MLYARWNRAGWLRLPCSVLLGKGSTVGILYRQVHETDTDEHAHAHSKQIFPQYPPRSHVTRHDEASGWRDKRRRKLRFR